MSVLHISPTGSGTGDGSSWANAARLADLSKMIQLAGPGGTVQLRADTGAYTLTREINLTQGGADGAKVTIMGVDGLGQPMNAVLSSTGNEIFVLKTGASNLEFQNLTLKNSTSAYGAIQLAGDIRNIGVEHVDAYNVRTFIGNVAAGSTTATVDGLVVRDVQVHGYSHTGIKLAYDTHNVLIENVLLEGKAGVAAYMEGVHLNGTVHDVVLRGVTATNNIYTGEAYWNGDGFATERGVYGVRFENTIATGNADAGYDLKSSSTVLDGAFAGDNKRNFRFWSTDITVTGSTGADPHRDGGSGSQAQVWLAAGAKATISNSTFTDHDPKTVVFDLTETGATLTLIGDTVVKDAAAALQTLAKGSSVIVQPAPAITAMTMAAESAAVTPVHIEGAAGDDSILGGAGDDYLRGGDGNDQMTGGAGFDDINGNAGADTLWGGDGADWVVGGKGDDLLFGDAGGDIVYGNVGADICVGGGGDDLIRGGVGNDSLSGGDGKDWLSGDRGDDTIAGGAGADVFHSFSGAGLDVIIDFSSASGDRIALDAGTQYNLRFSGQDTIIDMGGGDSVLLLGVTQSTLGDWLQA